MTDNTSPIHQFRFSLTREDVAAFEFLPYELQGAEKLWLFGPILFMGAASGWFEDELRTILPWDPGTQWGQVLIVLTAVAIGYGLSLVLLTARARYRIANIKLPFTAVSVDAYQDRVSFAADGVTQSFPWRNVVPVVTDKHVFLSYTPREAIIIPLRAFLDVASMRAFATFVEESGRDREDEDAAAPSRDNNKKETNA